jgi:hypothetical protein
MATARAISMKRRRNTETGAMVVCMAGVPALPGGGPAGQPESSANAPASQCGFHIGFLSAAPLVLGNRDIPADKNTMFSASKLTPEQIESLKGLAAQGATMSDLQRHLKDEHGVSITYMDTRFLVLDLGIELQEETKEEVKQLVETTQPVPTGTVSVTMDSLALPGALVSGKVTFSDGESAVWLLDQMGRFGLDPDSPGYRPSEEDKLDFQSQLRTLLQKSGF